MASEARDGFNESGVTTNYVYDGLNLIRETTAGANKEYVFGPSIDEPLAVYATGVVSYVNADALGSVVATNGPTGAVTHSSVFDAWGVAKTETGTRVHSFTYTGRETGEAGLHFYRSRQMNASTGAFTQEDPAYRVPAISAYSYVLGNPARFIDPYGFSEQTRNPPVYEPDAWNDGPTPVEGGNGYVQYSNNCYSYACNRPGGHVPMADLGAPFAKPQPGERSGRQFRSLTCAEIRRAMKADGLKDPDKSGCCGTGFYKIQLVIDPDYKGRGDFHYYREDSSGMWSHKPGWGRVTNRDASGSLVYDPSSANRNYSPNGPNYKVDCGVACTPF